MSALPPADHRFPRAKRLTRKAEFDAVLRRGRHVFGGPLRIAGLPNELGHNRLGLAITRRCGNAVQRNRIKRMLREAFRQLPVTCPGGYDLVIAARAHDRMPLEDYQQAIINAVLRIDRFWKARHEGS